MRDFLSVRVASLYTTSGKTSAVSQLFHDLRIKQPAYIKDPAVRLYFPGAVGKETPVELRGQDVEKLRTRKNDLKKYLKDVEKKMHERFESVERGKNRQHQSWQINTKPFSCGVLTFSELANAVDIDELWEKGLRAIQAVGEKYKIKLLYTALHTDETTRHFHYMFENLDADGRTFQSKLGRDGCSKLQDFYGEQLRELGFRRGINKKLSGTKHQDVMESHSVAREKVKNEVKKLQKDNDALEEKIKASTSILEGLLREKESIQRELEELEIQRKSLRRTKEELRLQTAAEKAETTALQQELRARREELKGNIEKIQAQEETIRMNEERINEVKAEDNTRRAMTEKFFITLRDAGVKVTLQRRRWKSGAWSNDENPNYTDLNKIDIKALVEIMNDTTAKQGCEWHLKTFGLPPVFCLDDLKKEDIEKMKRDGIHPTAVVETSPENYQVWVGFKNCFDYPVRMLTDKQWRLVIDYLHDRYSGDAAALSPGHQFRVPGFKRVNNPLWTAQLTETGGITDFKTIENEVMARIPIVEEKIKRTERIKKAVQENLGASTSILEGAEGVPEWFIKDKWVKFKTEIMKNPPLNEDGEVDWSRVDFRVVRDILKSTRRPDKLLEYQGYSYLMLKNEGIDRKKSRSYPERTLDAVLSSLDER